MIVLGRSLQPSLIFVGKARKNTLAYFLQQIDKEKDFYNIFTIGVQPFSFYIRKGQNKLKCLSLEGLSSLV